MKKSIGIRTTPKEIYYAIAEKNENINLEVVDSVIVPIALDTPEQLKFIRNTFIDIIYEFEVNRACIRISESTAKSISIPRTNIEAIIQELIASSTIEKFYIGQISNISSKLNIPRENFKKYISGELNFMDIEDWDSFKDYQRESIISSISSLKL